jgi:hypothetical protein
MSSHVKQLQTVPQALLYLRSFAPFAVNSFSAFPFAVLLKSAAHPWISGQIRSLRPICGFSFLRLENFSFHLRSFAPFAVNSFSAFPFAVLLPSSAHP